MNPPALDTESPAFIDRYGPYLDTHGNAFRAFLTLPNIHLDLDLGLSFDLRYCGTYPAEKDAVLAACTNLKVLEAQIERLRHVKAPLDVRIDRDEMWRQFTRDHHVVELGDEYHVFNP